MGDRAHIGGYETYITTISTTSISYLYPYLHLIPKRLYHEGHSLHLLNDVVFQIVTDDTTCQSMRYLCVE